MSQVCIGKHTLDALQLRLNTTKNHGFCVAGSLALGIHRIRCQDAVMKMCLEIRARASLKMKIWWISGWIGRNTWVWVKNRYSGWNPGKWQQRLKPAFPWWLNFDPYPPQAFCCWSPGATICWSRPCLTQTCT